MKNPVKSPPNPGANAATDTANLPDVSIDKPEKPEGNQETPEVEGDLPEGEAETEDAKRPQARKSGQKGRVGEQAKEQAGEKATRFQQSQGQEKAAKLPRQFGHKINTSPEAAKRGQLPQNLPDSLPKNQQMRNPRGQSQAQRPQPGSRDYRMAAQHRYFKGPGKNSPLQHKLNQRAQLLQNQQANAQRQATGEPLKKGEILQLARLRNNADNKDRFRSVIRNEIAKQRAQQARRVQSVNYQAESSEEEQQTQKAEKSLANRFDSKKQQIVQKLKNAVSKFEQVLQRVLSGSQKAVPTLPDGTTAKFLAKSNSEWNQFFKNVSNMNSTEIDSQGEMSELMNALFRGLFTKSANGKLMLVTDLSFSDEGFLAENKYSQVEIKNAKLADALKNLKPGETINPELLKQLGGEFDFIKLATMIQLANLTDAQKQEILKSFRQGGSPEAVKKLERQLQQKREEDQRNTKDKPVPFVYAGTQFDNKQRFKGKTRLFMLFFYCIMAVSSGLILYIILRAIL